MMILMLILSTLVKNEKLAFLKWLLKQRSKDSKRIMDKWKLAHTYFSQRQLAGMVPKTYENTHRQCRTKKSSEQAQMTHYIENQQLAGKQVQPVSVPLNRGTPETELPHCSASCGFCPRSCFSLLSEPDSLPLAAGVLRYGCINKVVRYLNWIYPCCTASGLCLPEI